MTKSLKSSVLLVGGFILVQLASIPNASASGVQQNFQYFVSVELWQKRSSVNVNVQDKKPPCTKNPETDPPSCPPQSPEPKS